jgi:alanine-glyoxylate transaminase/serine-glyoxylate transaminase/serine-pyruvate transaminase
MQSAKATVEDTMKHRPGRHFLQIPGPTNVPDRILRAMDRPVIDHRSAEFASLGKEVLGGIRAIFQTTDPVIVYPGSGTGAWEAAIVNVLSPGDKVLAFETGQFATLWQAMARRFGIDVDFVPGDWRHGVDPAVVEAKLAADPQHTIRAVMAVHNDTSTAITSRIPEIRKAMDRAGHPALLMVDTVSSLGSIDYRHGEWGVDVTVAGSQKGLMLPPGLGFNAVSAKALAASRACKTHRSYWDWEEMLKANETGFFTYTPATNLLYGLREAIAMLNEEGLEEVFARHHRHGEATRAAVMAWGLELLPVDPREFSDSLTAVLMPKGHDAEYFRKVALEKYDISFGAALGKLKGTIFRIGHLGDFNDLMLMGTLAGVEMGLRAAGVPHTAGGVQAAMDVLAGEKVHV